MSTLFVLLFWFSDVHAWGRRGHQIVGETAAQLAGDPGVAAHSFDVGYYANVPDLIWKRPATFAMERTEHYADMDLYAAAFKARPDVKAPLTLSRAEFVKTFPDLKDKGGAFWRIRELNQRLTKTADQLRAPNLTRQARFDLQLKWLVTAGVIGHYIGDLGQPLHTTSNHDGDQTHQGGIHSYFEDKCVDELYPELTVKVMERAKREWPAFAKSNANTSVLELTEHLVTESGARIDELLRIDRENKRVDSSRTCAKFSDLIIQRMTASALTLTEIYRRALGWPFDNNRFFMYAGEPAYIQPGEAD